MNLRGIVLAGGTGSRLMPLTKVTNKHLLPIGQKPMIFYPIEKLTSIGIQEILVVTGVEHMGDVISLHHIAPCKAQVFLPLLITGGSVELQMKGIFIPIKMDLREQRWAMPSVLILQRVMK